MINHSLDRVGHVMLAKYEISGTKPGPHLLITGGVHGDEFEPIAAIQQLMNEIRSTELRGRVTLVPIVNEPAYERGHRTAEDGLDLARTCPGKSEGSITERIAFELSNLIRTANFYIDLHTGGTRLMVLPLSGYMLHPNQEVLEQQRRMARVFGLPLIWGTDPHLDGRSLSVARDANIPAIYTEYEGGGRMNPEGVRAYVQGCLNVLYEFGLLSGSPVLPNQEPQVVEDGRKGSGHMQLNHPAPVAGFFTPAVELGQRVEAGTPLGTVVDPLGKEITVIRANYAGQVIVLHTFPRIDQGVSVAVILG